MISLPPATVHEQSLSLQITRSDIASGTQQKYVYYHVPHRQADQVAVTYTEPFNLQKLQVQEHGIDIQASFELR
jgi:hypothetical protein